MNLKTHTQFGDHCMCYGIVKEYAQQYDIIYLATKPDYHHFNNISRLYSSIPNVKIVPNNYVIPDIDISVDSEWYLLNDKYYKDPYLEIDNEDMIFDRYWYKKAGVPFIKKWDNFYFNRNLDKEKQIYNNLGLTDNSQFIFLQDDVTRNFVIDRKYIDSSLKLIESSKLLNISILDMLYIIEKAKEVHVINSSFLSFIDLMNIKHDNLNYHKYTRRVACEQPGLRLNWNIIE